MALETLFLTSSLPWSAGILGVSCVFLVLLLLLCSHCGKRKPKSPTDSKTSGVADLSSVPPETAEQQESAQTASEPQRQDAGESRKGNEQGTPVTKETRQLPDVPTKRSVRRHSSYHSANEYEEVGEVRSKWTAECRVSRRQTSDCNNLYEEMRCYPGNATDAEPSFPVYAQVQKAKPAGPGQAERDTGEKNTEALYSTVSKVRGRAVQSELFF